MERVFRGVYKKIGLKPSIVVYGKALGNGYAISALIGKKIKWILLKILLSVVQRGLKG